MKRLSFYLAITAMMLFAGNAALAQHGHSGGAGGMGNGHSMGSTSHDNQGPSSKASGSSAHGQTASEILSRNTKLSSKLQSLLPPGTNLQQAENGFKNLGQFVAAVHVSHNLGIPFDQLKAKMTGPPPESLGKAIHDLKPAADAKTESKKANKQAGQDLKESQSS
jgi:hypothetical protein